MTELRRAEGTELRRILCIDAAFRHVGIAKMVIFQDGQIKSQGHHTIVTKKHGMDSKSVTNDDYLNGMKICREISTCIKDWEPHRVVAEMPGGSQSAASAKYLGMMKMMLCVLGHSDTYFDYVTPHEVKKFVESVTGVKNASKRQIIEWAFKAHPESSWKMRGDLPQMTEEHAADAMVVYYAAASKGIA